MTNLICGICHEDLYIYYYKSNKCECNVRYHINCIIKWHKINNVCIYCKKKININLEKIKNRYLEHLIVLIIIIIIIITILFNFYNYNNYSI